MGAKPRNTKGTWLQAGPRNVPRKELLSHTRDAGGGAAHTGLPGLLGSYQGQFRGPSLSAIPSSRNPGHINILTHTPHAPQASAQR